VDYHLRAAREAEVEEENIIRALKLAVRIRQVTTGKIDDLIGEIEAERNSTK
jgi:transcriptional regulator NrdR family protein